MKLSAQLGDFRRLLQAEVQAGERAATTTIKAETEALKQELRRQVQGSFRSTRLANTWRSEAYPRTGLSLRPAGLVWSKAPLIIDAFDRGVTIRSKRGGFLAIPLPAAGRGPGGTRVTPRGFEQRTGLRLRLVYRRGRPSLLVVDISRLNSRGVVGVRTGRRRQVFRDPGVEARPERARVTVPVFVLLPQTKLPKRLDVAGAAQRASQRIPRAFVAAWERESGRRAA